MFLFSILGPSFDRGGFFMYPILFAFILGLAFIIERLIVIRQASTDTKKFLNELKAILATKGPDAAAKYCEDKKFSVSNIFYAGLVRVENGIEAVEKAIITYGSLEIAYLEKGLIWISLAITIAPMLGFTGTVQGMIASFDAIKEANQISPKIVASGISIALITTLFGLIVAMILQVGYNYIINRINLLVAEIEESTIEFMDILRLTLKNQEQAAGVQKEKDTTS